MSDSLQSDAGPLAPAAPATPLGHRCRARWTGFLADLKTPPSGPRFRWGTMVFVPLVFCLGLTFWARLSGFDLGAEKLIYQVGGKQWSLGEIPFWKYLYLWGTIPAAVVVLAALTFYCLSWSLERFRVWRKIFLFIVLTGVIGPGVITNGLLKEYWGRPRPREVIEMGGRSAFEPVLTIDRSSEGLSFPCGHATMGFFFMGGYFLLRRHRTGLARGFLLGSIILGSLMGVARMVQGGHFFTDVIWAGLICYFVPLGLSYGMGLDRHLTPVTGGDEKAMPLWAKIAVGSTGLAILVAVMIASPYQETRQLTFTQPFMEKGPLDLRLRFSVGTVEIVPAERFRLFGESLGHGFPTSGISTYYEETEGREAATFIYAERISGWFSELDSRARVEVPWSRLRRLRVETEDTTIKIDLAKVAGKPVIELVSGSAEVVIDTAGQPLRLDAGEATRIVGEERPDPGKSGKGGYRLQLAPEFTGTVRLIGRRDR